MFGFRRAGAIVAVSVLAIAPLGFAVQSADAEVQSASIPEAIAWEVTEAIVIDGNLEEWNLSSPIVLDNESHLIRYTEGVIGGEWTGPLDFSAKVYLMWDRFNLYVGAEVKDDIPFMYRTGFRLDLVDSLGLYLSTNPSADPARTSYESTDFRVLLVIDNNWFDTGIDRDMVENRAGIETRGMYGWYQFDGYKAAVREIEGGYTFEAKIPWSTFSSDEIPLFVPVKGMTIGFDVELNDCDSPCPGSSTCSMVWTGDNSIIQNPSGWGILIFK